jgi:hypothetical protein
MLQVILRLLSMGRKRRRFGGIAVVKRGVRKYVAE